MCAPVCHRYLLSVEILEARRNLYLQIPLQVTWRYVELLVGSAWIKWVGKRSPPPNNRCSVCWHACS